MVSDVLGEADDAFAAACQEVTAGNPLLLRQLLTALAAEQIAPDAEHAASVRAIGPRAVSRTVLLRLARLPAPRRARGARGRGARRAARAAGDRRAGRGSETEAAEAIDGLVRAEILRADEPLLRPPAGARRGLRRAAGGRARARARAGGAAARSSSAPSPERVAAQLMPAPPRGDAWVVERLREAAAIAVERGAPEAALAHLERAQAEPPAPELRSALTLELGAAAEFVRGTAAAEALARGHAALTDPVARGLTAVMLARTLLFMENPGEAMDVVDAARAELPAEEVDLDLALRAIRIVGVFFGVADPANLGELEAWRAGPRSDGPGAKTLTAITSLAVAVLSGDAAEAAALAAESLEGDEMPVFDRGTFTVLPATVLAMAEPADAEPRVAAHPRARRAPRVGAGRDRRRPLGRAGGDLDRRPAARGRAARAGDGGRGAVRQRRQRAHGVLVGVPGARVARARRARAGLGRAAPRGDRTGAVRRRALLDDQPRGAAARGRVRTRRSTSSPTRCATTRPPDMHPLWSPWRGLRAGRPGRRVIGRLRRASRPKSWRSLAAAPRRGSWGAHCGSWES